MTHYYSLSKIACDDHDQRWGKVASKNASAILLIILDERVLGGNFDALGSTLEFPLGW